MPALSFIADRETVIEETMAPSSSDARKRRESQRVSGDITVYS
jgi:hypothetical protein